MTKNYNGSRLTFFTLLIGLIFSLVISFIGSIFEFQILHTGEAVWKQPFVSIKNIIYDVAPFAENSSKTGVNAFVISLCLWLVGYFGEKTLPVDLKVKSRKNHVEKLLGKRGYGIIVDCFLDATEIVITMHSRKAYRGYVLETPNVTEDREDWKLKIFPVKGGYRDADTLRLEFIDNYDEVLIASKNIAEGNDNEHDLRIVKNIGITIKLDDIETIAKWVPELYEGKHQNEQLSIFEQALN